MEYRQIPANSDRVSILGFGCMRLPVRSGRIDRPEAARMIETALEGGVNYFDTAVIYHKGESESFLGEVLAGGVRDRVRIADKLSPWLIESPARMEETLAEQLKKLKTDRIDYYLLHALNRDFWEKLKKLGVLEFLERARRSGRILNTGFSYHGDPETFREVVDAYPWSVCQIQYNLLDRRLQAGEEGMRYAAARGVGVIVMEPLRGGALVRRLPDEVARAWSRVKGWSPAQTALRWLWNQPEISTVLSGMSAPEQVAENLAAAEGMQPGELESEAAAAVEEVYSLYRRLARTGCTGCRYCLPCPAGVNIPRCFSLADDLSIFGERRRAFRLYLLDLGGVNRKRADAGLCTGCGRCEQACPQQLPIRQLLREVDRELGGWRLRLGRWPARIVLKLMGLRRRLRRLF